MSQLQIENEEISLEDSAYKVINIDLIILIKKFMCTEIRELPTNTHKKQIPPRQNSSDTSNSLVCQ